MPSLIDTQIHSVPHDQLDQFLAELKTYISCATNPNELSSDGRSILQIAIAFAFDTEGQNLVADLLRRGADPNISSGIANLLGVLTACNSISLVNQLLDSGLNINHVYPGDSNGGLVPNHPFTVLDYVLSVNNYLGGNGLSTISQKTGVPLKGRRQFIQNVFLTLRDRGALTATEIANA